MTSSCFDAAKVRWDALLNKFVTLVDRHPVFENQVSVAFAERNPDRFLDAAALEKRLDGGAGAGVRRRVETASDGQSS
jgi:hypothetical protein